MNPEVLKYLSEIGARGGRNGRGVKARRTREQARKAALKGWAKRRAKNSLK